MKIVRSHGNYRHQVLQDRKVHVQETLVACRSPVLNLQLNMFSHPCPSPQTIATKTSKQAIGASVLKLGTVFDVIRFGHLLLAEGRSAVGGLIKVPKAGEGHKEVLALRNVAKKWTMPPRTWKQALNQFAVLFQDRFPSSIY